MPQSIRFAPNQKGEGLSLGSARQGFWKPVEVYLIRCEMSQDGLRAVPEAFAVVFQADQETGLQGKIPLHQPPKMP